MNNKKLELALMEKLLTDKTISVDLSESEIENLIKYYRSKEANSFALIIVTNLVEHKSFIGKKNDVVLHLTSTIADTISIKTDTNDNTIIAVAKSLYKFLFLLDIGEIYNNEF